MNMARNVAVDGLGGRAWDGLAVDPDEFRAFLDSVTPDDFVSDPDES